MTWKVLCWSRLRAPAADVWALTSDPAEVASLTPLGVRWELSDPEGLRRALREGSDRVFASRFRAFGRTLGLPLRVTQAEPDLRCALRSDPPWASRFELRMRLERAMADGGVGRVRLVHELIFSPRGPAPRLAVWAAERLLVSMHRRLALRLPVDPDVCGASRTIRLPPAMAGHADDPLGLSG